VECQNAARTRGAGARLTDKRNIRIMDRHWAKVAERLAALPATLPRPSPQRTWIQCSCYRYCNLSSCILVVHIESKGKAPHSHRASVYKSPPPSLLLWRETPEVLAPFFTDLRAEPRPSRGRPESCIAMEAPRPPRPCVRLVGPASPAPPSVAPTPLPAKHEGTVISAAPARSGAVVLPLSDFVDGGGSKVPAPVQKKKGACDEESRRCAASPSSCTISCSTSTPASAQEAIDVAAKIPCIMYL
jgi:hypothetical protein